MEAFRMTFDEWVARIDMKADSFELFPRKKDERPAWRCQGPCGQLMYGVARIRSWNYPSANVPAGNYIDSEFERVCEVCWQMHSVLSERAYWVGINAADKKKYKRLKPEGDFFAS